MSFSTSNTSNPWIDPSQLYELYSKEIQARTSESKKREVESIEKLAQIQLECAKAVAKLQIESAKQEVYCKLGFDPNQYSIQPSMALGSLMKRIRKPNLLKMERVDALRDVNIKFV